MQQVFIHPTAVVDHPTEIGAGSKIWHFCHVMAHAKLGQDCMLGHNGFVASRVRIGSRCRIQNNVSIFEGVELEDDVFVGPSAVFTNVKNPRAEICRAHQYLPTLVKKGCTIGANATILPGVTLGRYAFIAAGAVVHRDVPDYALMVGVPAHRIGWMSRAGERLDFDLVSGEATCSARGDKYRLDSSQMCVSIE